MTGTIIVAVDPSEHEEARDAIALGAQLASGYGARLHAVTVCATRAELQALGEQIIALLAAARVSGGVTAVPGGSPGRRLHELCDREHPIALVVGSGRLSPRGDARLGAIAETLLHGGAAPIAVASRGYAAHAGPLARVGVGLCETPESQDALRHASRLAHTTGAELKLLTVPDGDPATALAAASSHLDLLVVGSRSYGPLRAVLLGAVTRRLIPTASCSVMVVPRVPDTAHEGALVGGLEAAAIA